MALKGLGYRNDHPVIHKALEATHELIWDQGDSVLYQPCVSPNWDTALAAKALIDSGLRGDHPALRDAREVAHRSSDLQARRLVDQTARPRARRMGLRVLQRLVSRRRRLGGHPDGARRDARASDAAGARTCDRAGANWVMGMQSKDGGFAAFDVDNDSTLAQLHRRSPTSKRSPTRPVADLTGRVLEMMAAVGYRADHPVARRAIEWLKREQEADGSWWGRWGVNYIYGTFSALSGSARDRRRSERALDSARGRLAQVETERGRRMGRELPERQGSRPGADAAPARRRRPRGR